MNTDPTHPDFPSENDIARAREVIIKLAKKAKAGSGLDMLQLAAFTLQASELLAEAERENPAGAREIGACVGQWVVTVGPDFGTEKTLPGLKQRLLKVGVITSPRKRPNPDTPATKLARELLQGLMWRAYTARIYGLRILGAFYDTPEGNGKRAVEMALALPPFSKSTARKWAKVAWELLPVTHGGKNFVLSKKLFEWVWAHRDVRFEISPKGKKENALRILRRDLTKSFCSIAPPAL